MIRLRQVAADESTRPSQTEEDLGVATMEGSGPSCKVGDRVIISRPRSRSNFSDNVERIATVTAVRAKSFEAGGLCFRFDGREWGGRNRVRLVTPSEDEAHLETLLETEREFQADRTNGLREDMILAFLLSTRDEGDWLRLGLQELRKIAAMHGIPLSRTPTRSAVPGLLPEIVEVVTR